ncbi:hypothetical protein O6H91_09G060200 [Diphasiastrum complanatum]|uniref:Uncharacterized protein n=1 Tax=Diphasiastrum complanatum TaxID=34168 RepID=A0ACC2CPI8_DIPCM|nr:hypothetical protein O6H91_09G060200 [Diphasiastrum complanatum]
MLMYGFQPRAPMAVGLRKEKVQSVRKFLEDMETMIKIAKANVKQAQARAKHYADRTRRDVTFQEGDRVFLKVPEDSTTLSTGKCPKLSPRYCGPFTIPKRIGSSAYQLALPESAKVHPVFHVSRLERVLQEEDNIVPEHTLIAFEEPNSLPHQPEEILNIRNRKTRHAVFREVLVKWKDGSQEEATWESVSKLRKRYHDFVFEDIAFEDKSSF